MEFSFKGTVSRDWIGPSIVVKNRSWLIHMSCRYSDFLKVSSHFLIQIILLAACFQKTGGFALYWPPDACIINMRLAASRIQITYSGLWSPPHGILQHNCAWNFPLQGQCYKIFDFSRRIILHCKWRAGKNSIKLSGSHLCVPRNETDISKTKI